MFLGYLSTWHLGTWVLGYMCSLLAVLICTWCFATCKLYMLLEYLNTWVIVYLGTCYRGSWSSMCSLISFNQSVGTHPPVLLKWKSHSDYTFVTFSWDILSNFKLIQNIHYIVFVLLECGNTQINQNSHAYDTFVPPDLSITQRVP